MDVLAVHHEALELVRPRGEGRLIAVSRGARSPSLAGRERRRHTQATPLTRSSAQPRLRNASNASRATGISSQITGGVGSAVERSGATASALADVSSFGVDIRYTNPFRLEREALEPKTRG